MSKFEIVFDDSFDDEVSKLKKEIKKLREENENLKMRLRMKGLTAERISFDKLAEICKEQNPNFEPNTILMGKNAFDKFTNQVSLSTPTIKGE